MRGSGLRQRDKDVALLSGIDYSKSAASTNYGSGIELRLVDGELEFRFSERLPGIFDPGPFARCAGWSPGNGAT